jgi:pyridinium-3,5-biscarboxylic acid mononucleotide sulfurtransferase
MSEARARLEGVIRDLGPIAIAVSGGVDSMTLAVLAHRCAKPGDIAVVHAMSPAVPPEASERVREWAMREGWRLRLLDASEFDDLDYRRNPVNRCFFCKRNLYSAIASQIRGTIVSGTNKDDLGDYRPGLDAARNFDVRHPYVEAGIGKAGVRALARSLAMGELAELPASPCLSSRVETTIPIEPAMLRVIHEVEKLIASRLRPETVRCRVRASGFVIELDATSLTRLADVERDLLASVHGVLESAQRSVNVSFAPYRMGSAFVGARAS